MVGGKKNHGGGGGGGGGGHEEKRMDTDGSWYTQREFQKFYGGTQEWQQAERQRRPRSHRDPQPGKEKEGWGKNPFIPAGGQDGDEDTAVYGEDFEPHFWVPRRLRQKDAELISNVNDWHFPMLNDHARNEFYRDALSRVITPESNVLEIGAGSGLLSIIAASLGAKFVVAIEANQQLVMLARRIIKANGYEGKIRVLHKMSTDVSPGQLKSQFSGQLADVLVSELIGTLLLSESALHYVSDARKRLCKPDAAVIPHTGRQFVTLAESEDLRKVTSVDEWRGIRLSAFNQLQDTSRLVFSKVHGVRFSSLSHRWMSDAIEVITVDFCKDHPGQHVWPECKKFPFQATKTGVIHCAVASWSCHAEGTEPMSTHPDATRDNLMRDMQWGQGIQLIEDGEEEVPKPFVVTEGEWLDLVMRCSSDGVCVQFRVQRRSGPPVSMRPPPGREEPASAAAPLE